MSSAYSATDLVFENLLHELNSSGTVVVDYVLKLMGIDGCQDTVVGDAMLRGVSGGQKKRVTTAEMLVGFTQLLLMDEISTGESRKLVQAGAGGGGGRGCPSLNPV